MKILLLIFFFVSGAVGLVYEIVWTKLITLVIGSTVYSISTVLVAFMGGLALGSYVGGKLIDRKGDPFVVYGVLEGLIGLYCLVIPYLINATEPLFVFLYNRYYTDQFTLFALLRFVVFVIILLPPTAMMGATLPVLSKFFATRGKAFGGSVGKLYTINTLGAAIGCFGAGFVLLPALGKSSAILVAASGNLTIAALVAGYVILKGRGGDVAATERSLPPSAPATGKLNLTALAVLVAYAMNGFAGMAYQSAWTRAFSLSLGSSTYAFSLIVTAFILGLAGGAGVFSRIVDRLKSPARTFGWIEIGIGFSALGALWALGRLPEWMVPIIVRHKANYDLLLAMEFALVFGMILVPTFLMGAAFPLAVKTISESRGGAGAPVGLAYGWNTAGAIAGSFVAGFILIPLLGLEKTITTANAVNWIAGAGLLYVAGAGASMARRLIAPAAAIGLSIVATAVVPAWNPRLMDTGPFMYAGIYMNTIRSGGGDYWDAAGEQVFYDEGLTTTVSVRTDGKTTFLRVNGKTDASIGTDMATQILSGHLPMIFNRAPKDVLVVGLASGVTAGSVSRYSSVERIDVVEIAESVVEACARFFAPYNYNVLADPRTNLIVGDGRTHLRDTYRKYDAIVSEPSNPWMAGVSTLFTKEYFEAGREHLNPGGAMLIWIQGYGMDVENVRSVARTFSDVFPTVVMWEMGVKNGTDFGLLGFRDKTDVLDCEAMKAHFAEPGVAYDLAKIGVNGVPDLLAAMLFGLDGVAKFSAGARIHSDDHPFLEYLSPKSIYEPTSAPNLAALLANAEPPSKMLVPGCLDATTLANLERYTSSRREYLGALAIVERTEAAREEMISRLERSFKFAPEMARSSEALKKELMERAGQRKNENNLSAAIADIERAVGWFPSDGELYYLLGVAYNLRSYPGDNARAIEAFRRASGAGYNNPTLDFNLATALYIAATGPGKTPEEKSILLGESAERYLAATNARPDFVEALNGLGLALAELGRIDEALAAFEKAKTVAPSSPDAYVNLAGLSMKNGDAVRAASYLEEGARNAASENDKLRFRELLKMVRGK